MSTLKYIICKPEDLRKRIEQLGLPTMERARQCRVQNQGLRGRGEPIPDLRIYRLRIDVEEIK